MRKLLLVAVIVVGTVGTPRIGAGFRQVACATVISELNRVSRGEENPILAMEKVAKRLGTSPIWVENCMRSYGRPIPQGVTIDQDFRERLLERLEEVDLAPEDLAPEELEEPDSIYPDKDTGGTVKRRLDEYKYRQLPIR